MNCQNPLCGRGVLVDDCCLICGWGFKSVAMPRRRASKMRPKPAKKKPKRGNQPAKEPWWAR